jgi:hypothetical protein
LSPGAVHGGVSRVRAAAKSEDFPTIRILWETRMSSRFYKSTWPIAKGITNKLARLEKRMPGAGRVYDMLCDLTHPNLEANAALWRTAYVELGEHHAIRFDPGNSNSAVKRYIISAIHTSLCLIIAFARDLWWVAADITNTCDMTPNDRTLLLGLPARAGRAEPCSCGSGLTTRLCTHPEPEGVTDIELGRA